ncbi:MAG: endonuclease domain-containing protein [Citricoccus sp.]
MPPQKRPLPGHVPSIFSTQQVLAEGLEVQHLRHPDLAVISRGIRHQSSTHGDDLEHLAALQAIHQLGVFSHETAAAVWGMWLPSWIRPFDPVHVSKTRKAGPRPRRKQVKGHLLPMNAVIQRVRGVRVTGPAWTWVQLAGTNMSLEWLVAAGDSILQSSDGPTAAREPGMHPLSSVENLKEAIGQRTKMKGIKRAREVVELLREGSDSPQESRLRIRVVDAGFSEPVVNPEIILSSGERITPDLVWEDVKICVQYEGDHHRSDAEQWDRDIQRDRRMQFDGWIVLRVTKQVFSHDGWSAFVRDLRQSFSSRSPGA